MIRTLRRRFLLIALASLTGTLAVLCLVINLGYHAITTRRADQVLQMLHQNAGQFPEPETQADPGAFPGFQVTLETPFETRYVVVRLTGQREVAEVDMEHIAALDREKVIQQVEQILDGGKTPDTAATTATRSLTTGRRARPLWCWTASSSSRRPTTCCV